MMEMEKGLQMLVGACFVWFCGMDTQCHESRMMIILFFGYVYMYAFVSVPCVNCSLFDCFKSCVGTLNKLKIFWFTC